MSSSSSRGRFFFYSSPVDKKCYCYRAAKILMKKLLCLMTHRTTDFSDFSNLFLEFFLFSQKHTKKRREIYN